MSGFGLRFAASVFFIAAFSGFAGGLGFSGLGFSGSGFRFPGKSGAARASSAWPFSTLLSAPSSDFIVGRNSALKGFFMGAALGWTSHLNKKPR